MSTCKANSSNHEGFMACAMDLAIRGRGTTAPNPCVGAVLVDKDTIVAGGWHTKFGALHAERECLASAKDKGIDPRGMTMYVTLEPCNHHGKTPPCTEALIEAGIATVVIGTRDPNPVAAGGLEKLEKHGINVVVGVLEQECKDLIADFLLWQNSHSPFNIVKMAATLDGKIASRARTPEPVSSPESFNKVHELRARVGAVVVGGGTFYADNPSLTCRLEGRRSDFTQPFAVVITSRLPENPEDYTLLTKRGDKTIFMTTEDAARSPEADALRTLGTSVWPLPGTPGHLNLSAGFERLRYDLGCHYTLCEGGGRLAMHLVEQGLADELVHFVAPRILGDDHAPAAYAGRRETPMALAFNFRIISMAQTGTDIMVTMRPR
ncbi:bifunctional diaminohydroxyphosphoribosylaminopyrimidine deaminase/5-amino-6-(5-phosphoribosylamino)uracil reductase RibD [Pseudodesulfovibrio sp.]|nr:bifunctional diaminohydroxyphosphoribosylaminopyrimidine deaminase/5-amino-6-(5-phosphoribosylamino)uracil reductase RibD [Pseudodesulfovibrio sp.]